MNNNQEFPQQVGPWKRLSSQPLFSNKWFKVRLDTALNPIGVEVPYPVIENHPSVIVVAMTDDEQIYLERIFRYPTEMWSWEVAMGGSEGQDVLEAAKRELREELGLEAKDWHEVGWQQAFNGRSNEISHIFLARQLQAVSDNEQAEEGISQIKKVPLQNIDSLIAQAEITDTQTIAAIAHVRAFLLSEKDQRTLME